MVCDCLGIQWWRVIKHARSCSILVELGVWKWMKSESTTYQLEVIFDYGSVFVAYGKITETKSSPTESSFPAQVPLIKLIGAANLQVPQEHQIRMRSDEREKAPCTKLNFCLAMQTTIWYNDVQAVVDINLLLPGEYQQLGVVYI